MNCPLHNVYTMKHNPGCPFAPKCPHENGPKCAHPKKKKNQNNNNISSSNNNSLNNSQNSNVGPHSHMPNNQNFPNNNGPYNNNMPNNNNYNNDGSKNSSPGKITYVYDEQNRNNVPFGGHGNNGPNFGPNNNINNNGPYNNFNNPNNNNNYPNNNGPFNQNNNNNNPNGPNHNDGNNNEEECPMSPVSSAYPPNDEEGQKGNWVFCPKCNVYHRCPHPGCEHNAQKRTTTHKCIHEDEDNQNDPNNINFPGNNQGSMSNSGMGQSGKDTGRKSKRTGVFASCPYQEELGQFVDFLGFLMEVESRIEDLKIDLARREDFNFEDIFRMFEVDGKGYIEPDDLKEGLKLLGLNPSNNDIKLLMKRFDLNQQGLLSYTDFFDMVITFEKRLRNTVQVRPPNSCCSCKSPDIFECDTLIGIKNLFKLIIQCETEINNRRKNLDSLRSKYSDVVQFLDYSRRGVINRSDLKLYLTQFNKFTNSKECDLLFIRLDKTRSGEVGIDEIENELMFIR